MINDTIAAVITAIGAASVGIIRISGIDALKIGKLIYQGKEDFIRVASHSVLYGKVYNYKKKKIIDEALFLVMKEPATFTGENIVEIQCHGGMVAVQKVLELVLENGARLAEPGEFSKRAFLNGKLDLAQAESIMDIVNAKTDVGLEIAVNQLKGTLSSLVNNMRLELLKLIAFMEADIDFPDEDIERLTNSEQLKILNKIKSSLASILKSAQQGKIIREGLNVIIIGKPNVGKSSLLNAFLNEARAIVTDVPGTTRDVIEEYVNLGGIPIKLMDTAGIRDTENLVEKLGVDRTKRLITKADLILYVLDIVEGFDDKDLAIINHLLIKKPTIYIANKADLAFNENNLIKIKANIKEELILISAKENEGLEVLEEKIKEIFFVENIIISDKAIITNARHVQALQLAIEHIIDAIDSLENQMPGDFVVIDIRSSWEYLGRITGDTIEEDILDKIFSQFCLGK